VNPFFTFPEILSRLAKFART